MEYYALEKALEALIDDITNDMGEDARSCYVLKRLEAIMLEIKSANNSEVLREIGGYVNSNAGYRENTCTQCGLKR